MTDLQAHAVRRVLWNIATIGGSALAEVAAFVDKLPPWAAHAYVIAAIVVKSIQSVLDGQAEAKV